MMEVYKTTPDNITQIITFQASNEEGLLVSNCDYNLFLPNYTIRISETLDVLPNLIKSLSDLIDKVSSGVLASNGGGAITSPTFQTDLAAIKTQLDSIKQNISDIKKKL